MIYLLKNGRVVDPANGFDAVCDVRIGLNGLIAEVGPNLDAADGVTVVDCTGLVVAPGLIDMHVHLRVPGQEYKEDVAIGNGGCRERRFYRDCLSAEHGPADRQAGDRA